ncbi:DUF3331 domain-containing protein [Paraburkholderia sp. BL18I3N2]|uniref:DUF3331 domain-containing protein n=1 Tax=Paraburkholderia sp. BL18I3N2 TaxID=1938799 RepID=UPI0035BE7E70
MCGPTRYCVQIWSIGSRLPDMLESVAATCRSVFLDAKVRKARSTLQRRLILTVRFIEARAAAKAGLDVRLARRQDMDTDLLSMERGSPCCTASGEDHQGAIGQILQTILSIHSIPDSPVLPKPLGTFRKSRHVDNRARVPLRVLQPARLEIVDRPSRTTVTVFWSDALSGHYSDQMWRLGRSQVTAVCVLTGTPILIGDPIFRPHCRGRSTPGNRDAMIRADAICHDLPPYRQLACGSARRVEA